MSKPIPAQTYLSRHYFDDEKLRKLALNEFVRCMRTGKMAAFVGSMATQELGYPGWFDLIEMAIEVTKKYAKERAIDSAELSEIMLRLKNEMNHNPRFDGRVVASVIGAWIDYKTETLGAGEEINRRLAVKLQECNATLIAPEAAKVITNLRTKLNITKFITTNYDLELEFVLSGLKGCKLTKYTGLSNLVGLDLAKDEKLKPGESLSATLADGNVLVSDAFIRERLDRLIEFSIGGADTDYHVFHLHGHVWQPESMIVSYRDYDRLYRRAGASKVPFEESLALLYSATPILFVGLGMKEPELNATLEELVGNQPFKGVGRRFLLWNAPGKSPAEAGKPEMSNEDRKANFRLEMLHKLGVLTIFDDELDDPRPVIAPGHDLPRLAKAIEKLGTELGNRRQRRLNPDGLPDWYWRTIDFNGERAKDPIQFTWHFERELERQCISDQAEFLFGTSTKTKPAMEDSCLFVQTSRPGTLKGKAAAAAAIAWSCGEKPNAAGNFVQNIKRPVMLVNTSLRLDTDSILESLRLFLRRAATPQGRKASNQVKKSRETLFDEGRLFFPKGGRQPLIIFKGLERLFSKSGVPLSAEVDGFFRSYMLAALRWRTWKSQSGSAAEKDGGICRILVFGTRRIRIYFGELQRSLEEEIAKQAKMRQATGKPIGQAVKLDTLIKLDRRDGEPDGYVRWLRSSDEFDLDRPVPSESPPLAEDRAFARRTYTQIFESPKFIGQFRDPGHIDLAFAVLTIMAFVGQPVEADVLFHAPRVRNALMAIDADFVKQGEVLKKVMGSLKELHLVSQIARPKIRGAELASAFDEKFHTPRFALHMSLQAEMRERYGVPLSEAALSTSFNMSLYASQPADAVVPEPKVHDELGQLIDWFIGIYQDDFAYNPENRHNPALPVGSEKAEMDRRARPQVAAGLRAALAILRGFYSTSALLSLDLDDRLVGDQRDGALTEHADRLARLIQAFQKLGQARVGRSKLLEESPEFVGPDAAAVQAKIRKAIGPGSIYKDELVWLYNEHGVVKLTQGDLYEARLSFNEADRVNRTCVEFNCRSHNWRRIWLNQVVVDLERGKLAEAEDRLARIENSFNQPTDVEQIRHVLGKLKAGMPIRLPLNISHEDCLAIALTTGYRALAQNLRGELHGARRMFELSIAMLEALDEQRAVALMRRHFSSLLFVMDGDVEMVKVAKLAIAGAESSQQMDIAYSARMVRHYQYSLSQNAEHRLWAMRFYLRSLEFASQTDLHRVAIEARRSLASLKLGNGDLESALEHARTAMALAGRYGFSLFKISLRILMGRILLARENQAAGQALIKTAISQADRIGYQRAVDAAQYAIQGVIRGS